MKLKAARRYVDRYTKKIVEKGTSVEADEARAGELIKEGAAVLEDKKMQK